MPPPASVPESWLREGRSNTPCQLLDLSGQRGRGNVPASYWTRCRGQGGGEVIPSTISLKKIGYESECIFLDRTHAFHSSLAAIFYLCNFV